MLNLDTHVLIHALAGQLKKRERELLQDQTWSISAIVLWEIAKLAQLGRVDLDLDDPEVGRILNRLYTWPITLEIARRVRDVDVHVDPADEIIAATSLVHGVPLVTRDRKLLASKAVPLAR